MTRDLVRAAALLAAVGATSGCSSLMFWRDARLVGKVKLADEAGGGVPTNGTGVTVNFINLGSKIEESLLSVQSDAAGAFRSPKITPGKYKVEAMYPGYVIESMNVEVKSHQHKKANVVLKKIREARGKSVKEGQEENIPTPGEVKITPPPY
jgi:hypothetical protein